MELKEEIKNSIKLSDVIGKRLPLKRRDSNNYVALCPFHKEKTPSFNVSDDKVFIIVLVVEKMETYLVF